MSESISDSEACGNDYDNTWSPPTEESGNDWDNTWNPLPKTATKSISNFTHSWKSPWKKIDIFLVDSCGKKEIISDETGCFVPVKFQYLITHRIHHLQSLIEKIQLLDVKSIQTSDEFVEITTKTDVHPEAGAEVSTVLSNELEDIYLKIIPRLPFTCTFAEELFQGHVELMVARDESKVYIVGPLASKTLICNTIDQFKNLINKETIIFDEKWKVLAMGYLNAVQFLATRYPNVSVKIKEDTKIVLLQGTKSEVQNAVQELHDLVDSVHVEHIHLDPLVIKLLHFSDASSLFTSIIKSQRLDVSWTIDGDNLIVVSKETIPIGSVQQLVVQNFVSVGFSSEADSQNDFTKSKAFLDQVQTNKNPLLVAIKESNGYRVASTKAVIRDLLQNEHSHNDMVCKSEQVNEIEVSKLRLELNSTRERLHSANLENVASLEENKLLNTEIKSLIHENKSLESRVQALSLEQEEQRLTISRYEEKKLSKHVARSSADTQMLKKADTTKCQNVDVQNRFEIARIITVNLTETEYGMLKTFCPRSRILSGMPCIDKDALCVVLQQNEKADEVIKQFQSDIELIKTLNTTEIRFISGITERQFKDIKDSSPSKVYCYLSIDKKVLTMCSETYASLQGAKYKAEVYLGLQQQTEGRRNRVVPNPEPVYTFDSRNARFNGNNIKK